MTVDARAHAWVGKVRNVARRLARRPYDVDELESVGYVGLAKALRTYSDSSGVTFDTHANRTIRSTMIDSLRQPLYGPSRGRAYGWAVLPDVPSVSPWPSVETCVTLDAIVPALTPRQQTAYGLYRQGHRLHEIGAAMGVTESAACHMLKAIRVQGRAWVAERTRAA